MANSRVLLADSIGIIREGLAALIRRLIPEAAIEHAETADEIKAAMRGGPWRLIVFNPALPSEDGVALIRLARMENRGTPVLVFTMLNEGQFGVAALDAGATGYLEATARSVEIVGALRALLDGGVYLSPRLSALWNEHGRVRNTRKGFAALSTRERRVLRALAEGAGVKEAAQALGVTPSTIGTYRVRLLKKLKLKSTGDLIRYVAESRLDGGSNNPFGKPMAEPKLPAGRRRVG